MSHLLVVTELTGDSLGLPWALGNAAFIDSFLLNKIFTIILTAVIYENIFFNLKVPSFFGF